MPPGGACAPDPDLFVRWEPLDWGSAVDRSGGDRDDGGGASVCLFVDSQSAVCEQVGESVDV